MDKNLKIAHCVQDYPPGIGGMAEVVRQLSERLVAMGHEVTVFTSFHPKRNVGQLHGVKIRSYDLSGNAVEGIIGDPQPYLEDLHMGNFDVVTIFAAQHWACDLLLPILQSIKAVKVFVPTGFSALHNPRYHSYFQSMQHWLHGFDRCVFLSNTYQDIEFAKSCGITKYVVIPNGADDDEFLVDSTWSVRKELKISNEKIILHVGSYTGIKGHVEALKIFLAADLKNTVLLLVGAKNSYLKKVLWRSPGLIGLRLKLFLTGKKVFLVEWNREQTIAAFQQADLFLFPSLVECSPIVLFECMAAGLPFFSTPVGNAEELVLWSDHAGKILPVITTNDHYVHADIERSAILLRDTMQDQRWLQAASVNGKKAWKQKFTWKLVAEQYNELYQKIYKSL